MTSLSATAICIAVSILLSAVTHAYAEIIGGRSISITQAPWQLWMGNCGAAWVGGRNVLIAQHCIDTKTAANTFVWAGITRVNQATTANRIAVAEIIKMGTPINFDRDISILKLAADLPANTLARPIRFATAADVTAGYTDKGVECMATGWGRTVPNSGGFADSLQMVMSKVANAPADPVGVIRWGGLGGSQQIGACHGDSGSPLVVKDGAGNWILAGLASYLSSTCGDPAVPSNYARVSSFTSFFQQNGVTQPVTSLPDFRFAFRGGPERPQAPALTLVGLNGVIVSRTRPMRLVGAESGSVLQIGAEGPEARHLRPARSR